MMADGADVSVESVARTAGISRTTAYRYFPTRHELIAAAHPQIEAASLLPEPAPDSVDERLELVMRAFLVDITVAWEPQLRAALRQSLAPAPAGGYGVAVTSMASGDTSAGALRQGRAVGWIAEALGPLRRSHPRIDIGRLAVAIRSSAGIESLVWLTDVAGLSRDEAVGVMQDSARALLSAAVRDAS